MDRRLVKVVVWLVLLVFLAVQMPSAGAERRPSAGDAFKIAAKLLAMKLIVALPKILERFKARRQELLARGGGDAYPRAGVAELLDSTEASLQKELRNKDFAPLRDYVAEVFDNARSGLGLPTSTAFRPLPAPQATLASLRLTLVGGVPDSLVDRILADLHLDAVGEFLADLTDRARRKDLTVDLCVVSVPPKAKVLMHTATGREIDPTNTNGRFVNLLRGTYFYTVTKRKFPPICEHPIECRIRLYEKKQPVLSCELSEGQCIVQEGWSGACVGR